MEKKKKSNIFLGRNHQFPAKFCPSRKKWLKIFRLFYMRHNALQNTGRCRHDGDGHRGCCTRIHLIGRCGELFSTLRHGGCRWTCLQKHNLLRNKNFACMRPLRQFGNYGPKASETTREGAPGSQVTTLMYVPDLVLCCNFWPFSAPPRTESCFRSSEKLRVTNSWGRCRQTPSVFAPPPPPDTSICRLHFHRACRHRFFRTTLFRVHAREKRKERF